MTDTKMSFYDALISHLKREKVEVRGVATGDQWWPLLQLIGDVNIAFALTEGYCTSCEFRIKPRTVMCNGVEVTAPESASPAGNVDYFVPDVWSKSLYSAFTWDGDNHDMQSLGRGLVYLNKEDAIARAKAMLITK